MDSFLITLGSLFAVMGLLLIYGSRQRWFWLEKMLGIKAAFFYVYFAGIISLIAGIATIVAVVLAD